MGELKLLRKQRNKRRMRPKESIFILMLALLSVSISFGQNLNKHRWKDRVLLIISNDSAKQVQQIDVLKKDLEGIKERKLFVYVSTPFWMKKNMMDSEWERNTRFYEKVKKMKGNFEVALIGLDGGVKLRQTEVLSLEKLFTLIDGMPMRRAEIKN